MFVAIIAIFNWNMLLLDIILAYVNYKLKEEDIYVKILEGLKVHLQYKEKVL